MTSAAQPELRRSGTLASVLTWCCRLDYFDPAADFGDSLTRALQNVKAKFFVASFSTDWRFSPARSKELVKALISAHKPVQYIEVKSNHGHDAFLMENETYMRAIAAYMNNVDKDCRS